MRENNSSFENELNINEKLLYTNVGVSMLPLIREGRDIMLIEKCEKPPQKYDVVLFRRDGIKGRGKYILHRILKVLPEDKYYIVGDNCTEGEIVDASHILGVLTTVFRDGSAADFSGVKYKMYVNLWCAPYRFRFCVLKVKRFIKYFISAVRYKVFGK